jgi:hypothetical protein
LLFEILRRKRRDNSSGNAGKFDNEAWLHGGILPQNTAD